MGEKTEIIKEEFRYNGIAHFKDTYTYAYEWLKDRGFAIAEEKYEEVASGEAKELRIKWTASIIMTDYFKIHLEIAWQALNMKDIEVEIDGKKKKMQKLSELKLTIKGLLETDYKGQWGMSGFQKFMRGVYDKFIMPSRSDEMWGKTAEAVQDFKEEMKAFLDLTARRFQPQMV